MGGVSGSPDQSAPLSQRWVHVDINSYFATMLQQENPVLRGKPVGVVKDTGRQCVIAASKEAKKFGISTGCLLSEARRRAPEIIAVPAHFELYLGMTTKLKQVFESLAPEVNIFSLDEAFINLSNCHILYPDTYKFGELVQRRIKAVLGEWVTCNVGISHTRLLAKMTSEISPKGSITEVTPDNKNILLAQAEFHQVCGVGYRLADRLKKFNVTTPFQINFIPDADLEKEFGPFWSQELRKIGQGEDTHFFTRTAKVDHMQCIGRSLTCWKPWNDEESLKKTLYNLTEEVIYKVRKLKLAGCYVGISLRGRDQRWSQERRVGHYIRHTHEMFAVLYDELYGSWQRNFPIIKCSVQLGGLKPLDQTPQLLWPEWHDWEKAYQAVDEINHKYGLFTLRGGTLLKTKLIKQEVTGFLGDKDYQLGRLSN